MKTIVSKVTPLACTSGLARIVIHLAAWRLGKESRERALRGIRHEFQIWLGESSINPEVSVVI